MAGRATSLARAGGARPPATPAEGSGWDPRTRLWGPPARTGPTGACRVRQVPYAAARNPRSRSELPTTNTEENAIAAPAIIGFSRPIAARGSAATL